MKPFFDSTLGCLLLIAILGGVEITKNLIISGRNNFSNALKNESPILSRIIAEPNLNKDIKQLAGKILGKDDEKTESDELFKKGIEALNQGQPATAVIRFTNALKVYNGSPGLYKVYIHRAEAHCRMHNYSYAISDYTEALKEQLDSKDKAWIIALKGGAHMALGDYDKAIHDTKNALLIDPQCQLAFLNFGLMKIIAKDIKGAKKYLTRAQKYGSKEAGRLLELLNADQICELVDEVP